MTRHLSSGSRWRDQIPVQIFTEKESARQMAGFHQKDYITGPSGLLCLHAGLGMMMSNRVVLGRNSLQADVSGGTGGEGGGGVEARGGTWSGKGYRLWTECC